jgi:hypothetical protein
MGQRGMIDYHLGNSVTFGWLVSFRFGHYSDQTAVKVKNMEHRIGCSLRNGAVGKYYGLHAAARN